MRWTLPKPSTGPQGGHGLLMTLHPNQSAQPNNAQAPVLPADRARGEELWNQVKGTAKEADFRSISKKHEQKNENRANYIAFLDELCSMFAVPQPQSLAALPPVASTPEPLQPTPTLAQPVIPDAEQGGGQDDPARPNEDAEEDEDGDDVGEDVSEDQQPAANGAASDAPLPPTAPPVQSGLLAQLAGMLADGGELTLQLMRVGDTLTVGVFPKPHPGEGAAHPLILSETPDWLDQHLAAALSAAGGYAAARREAFAVCQAAATKQHSANKKVAEGKTSQKSASTKTRTSTVTLTAAEGTTFAGKIGNQAVTLAIGENEVPQGTLEITASHTFYGECKKTLSTYAPKTHDFTDQQGARVTVNVTPESAAVTAIKGETVLALHGETLLPPGSWLVEAEASGHTKAAQRLSVKAGKPQVIELQLQPEMTPSLF